MTNRKKTTKADESLLTGPFIALKPGDLEALAQAAKTTHDTFLERIAAGMTKERATSIRQMRVDEGCSWRAVAACCHEEWGKDADWYPESNQLAGMALCELAAKEFGEDYKAAPWN